MSAREAESHGSFHDPSETYDAIMHELSLLRGLMTQIQAIAAEHRASRVRVVRLKLGPLAHIEPDHLREHFVEAAIGTIAESAELLIETTDELHELSLESIDVDSAGADT